jgi:hypothetical protein
MNEKIEKLNDKSNSNSSSMLYKYRDIEKTLAILENRKIWHANVESFNAALDCNLYEIEKLSADKLKQR